MGHDVVLLPPDLVRPYRRGSKNDRADTKALLEAYRNEEILSVPIKSVRQHTLAALHRLRSGWLSTRTARINAVRGILRELGLLKLWVAVIKTNRGEEYAGHLFFGGGFPRLRIFQIVVKEAWRRYGIGSILLSLRSERPPGLHRRGYRTGPPT